MGNAGTRGYQGGSPPLVQAPPGQASKNRPHKKKGRYPIWVRAAVAALLVLLILTGAGSYYYYTNFASPVGNIVGQSAPLLKGQDDPNQGRDSTNILSGGRINILLLGSDTDAKFQNGYLAQTDIVVTIDPATKSVGMLSIPRDLFINVPGYGMMKLDEAYYYGQAYNNGNGVGLSRLTISQDFGIPINYYAWVGLSGFIKVVDTAGGVDIDATHPITDDVYPDDTGDSQNAYAYKRLYIPPGPQHLDGLHALEYVRSRHADLVGDFGRSARQQQILSNLKTRLVNSSIISRLPELAKDMNGYLKTDMQILQVVELMNFARTIDPNKIQRIILSPPTYSVGGTATQGHDNGESIFNPICAPIQQAIAKMFALGNNAKCDVQGSTNNNTPVLAQTSQPAAPVMPSSSNTSWQTASQMASMSLDGSNSYNDFGIRSLLDLLLMVVFESPAALQA
jgi:LCP family protein required for cell wall assembly